jgi:hypothetical protein
MSTTSHGSSADVGIALNLAANAIWAVLVFGGRRLLKRLDTADPRHRRRVFIGIASSVGLVLAVALWLLARSSTSRTWGWLLVASAAVWCVVVAAWELNRFWRVGVLGADRSVGSGIDYDASLHLVKAELSFLGTGAHKLSRSGEFEVALRRCRSDVPIRLLLRRPDDPALASAARRAGRSEGEYRENVIESLRAIARLQGATGNIEVRFYDGDLVFRMMLIDRRIALVSFNVYGLGDGSELPQLHLVNASERHAVSTSFFHAFERYFNERWAEAMPWDFRAHI